MSELMHYGTPRHSGRYPWGSGKNPQRSKNLVSYYNELKAKGFSDADIAKGLKLNSAGELKARISLAKNDILKENMISAFHMHEDGKTNTHIAERLGVSEGTVRSWIKMGKEEALGRRDATQKIADKIKQAVDEKGYIDIGSGVEISLDTNASRKKKAVELLKAEGYEVFNIQQQQQAMKSGMKTTRQVIAPPGTTFKDVVSDPSKITTIVDYEKDPSDILKDKALPPVESIKSDRIWINYAETGGTKKDGVIELRRGLEDLNLGSAQYAQVRIGVDDKMYLKGMAMYSDNVPEGYDVIFNTNKHAGTPIDSVLKPMKTIKDDNGNEVVDQDNPFGASIKSKEELRRVPRTYIGADGKEHISPINVVNEEGDWREWSRTIASQMLSKQPLSLAKKQLNLTYEIKRGELDDILALTNPVVKKKMLEEFASACDANAAHLKAAALPRQSQKVILPIDSLKDNEIYAPGYKAGETVALIRYPHAGTFEIPVLKVTHSNKEALSVMKNATDAVGINSKVAEHLSGADFDGDSVVIIPTGGSVKIKADKPLFEDFDPKEEYGIKNRKEREAAGEKLPKRMTKDGKGKQMGIVSNLITDMTIQKAPKEDMILAVKHSMVVIDSEKHDLDYRQSAKDNEIERLRRTYQIQPDGSYGGAATLLSRAKSTVYIDSRREKTPTKEFAKSDEYTGERIYEDKPKDTRIPWKKDKEGNWYRDEKTGVVRRQEKTTAMDYTNDARTLISEYNQPIEREYATFANRMKSLANEARKALYTTDNPKRDPVAAKKYAAEVKSLDEKLKIALSNSPRERQAQALAAKMVSMKKEAYPEDANDKEWVKKIKNQSLRTARAIYGAEKKRVEISPKEWEAIQAHAIGSTNLAKILNNADMDIVKKYATPRTSKVLTPAQIATAKRMLAGDYYSLADVADKFGVSESTVTRAIE